MKWGNGEGDGAVELNIAVVLQERVKESFRFRFGRPVNASCAHNLALTRIDKSDG